MLTWAERGRSLLGRLEGAASCGWRAPLLPLRVSYLHPQLPYSAFLSPRNPGHPSPAASCPGSARFLLDLGVVPASIPAVSAGEPSRARIESVGAVAQPGNSPEIDTPAAPAASSQDLLE